MQRTNKQNNSLHAGLKDLGDALNAGGLDMRKVLKESVDIPWTQQSVKEFMFNPISVIMHNGRTSSELSTIEIKEVWAVMIRFCGEKHAVTVAWPERDGLKYEKND